MPMTVEESRAAFESLSDGIQKAGLGWILNQVIQQVRLGKPELKRVRMVIEPSSELLIEGLEGRRRTSREVFAATREYTAHEQLSLLLDALERALVSTFQMEGVIREQLFGKDASRHTVRLVRPDEPENQGVEVMRSANTERSDRVRDLHRLVSSLREMM
jgi:hypothetical protein